MLERKIYSDWAGSKDSVEIARINESIFKEIKHKAQIRCVNRMPSRVKFKVINNPENLTNDELALICDCGNLCYGYRIEGEYIIIYTD